MSDNNIEITPPVITLTGTQLYADGTQHSVSLTWDQSVRGGTPSSITTHLPIMFVGSVTVTMTSPDSAAYSYAAAPTEDADQKLNGAGHATGISTPPQSVANILYYFNQPGKQPSVSQCKPYTGSFQIVKPGKSFSGKGYVFSDDIITLNAIVQYKGRLSANAVAFIKII